MSKDTKMPAWDGEPVEVKIAAEVQEIKAALFKRIEAKMFAKVLEGDLPDELLELVHQAGKGHEAILQKRDQRRADKELEALLGI